MNTFWIVMVVLVVFVLIAKLSQGAAGASGTAAKEKIKAGATVIDVRTREEFAGGHYQGARNIPLQELQKRLAEAGDKKKAIVVYCASGMRSAQAAKLLTKAGFTDVTNAGGLKNLE